MKNSRLTEDFGTFPLWVMFLVAFSLAMRILCFGAIFSDDLWIRLVNIRYGWKKTANSPLCQESADHDVLCLARIEPNYTFWLFSSANVNVNYVLRRRSSATRPPWHFETECWKLVNKLQPVHMWFVDSFHVPTTNLNLKTMNLFYYCT